jgi:hypothetical protein
MVSSILAMFTRALAADRILTYRRGLASIERFLINGTKECCSGWYRDRALVMTKFKMESCTRLKSD